MRLFKTELQDFYASTALRHFGLALISLFVPAFLYKELGFPVWAVLAYFVLQEAAALCFDLALPRLILRVGLKASMLLSVPFIVATYLLLPLAANPVILLVVALTRGVFSATYYPAFHACLARASKPGRFGSSTGRTWFWLRLSIVFAPLLGGVLLQFAGFAPVFALLVLFQLAAYAVLPEIPHDEKSQSMRSVYSSVGRQEKFSWFAQGVTIFAGDYVWSLAAFFVLQGYAELGAFAVAGGLVSAAFSWWMGDRTDSGKRGQLQRYGFAAGAAAWLFRVQAQTAPQVLAGNVAGDVAFMSMEPPLVTKIYQDGIRNGDLVKRICLREATLRLSIFPVALGAVLFGFSGFFLAVGAFFAATAILYRAQ